MSKVTKKTYLETIARIEARNAEPINPIQLTLDGYTSEQLTPEQYKLLNPANFILPAQPIKSELAEAWETAHTQWRGAWNDTIWRTVQNADFGDIVNLEPSAGWRGQPDRPAKSVGTARIALQQEMHKLQEAIDKATALTNDLQGLEMSGARAEFEDWQTKARLYHWHIKSFVEAMERQVERDQEVVAQYEWQQKSKAWNDLHEEAFREDWSRRFYPEQYVTASA